MDDKFHVAIKIIYKKLCRNLNAYYKNNMHAIMV